MVMLNGTFGSPWTASDGIQEIAVTDDSMRIVIPLSRRPVKAGRYASNAFLTSGCRTSTCRAEVG
jgi:hypothetical protein